MISENLKLIRKELDDKCQLLAVSKTKPVSAIEEALATGQIDFGENKVQELFEKATELADKNIRWHFIGTLQSNKLNKLLKVPNLYAIHSIDSLSLVEKIMKKDLSNHLNIFLQVNTSGEDEKSGFRDQTELVECLDLLQSHSQIKVLGLMTIGSIRSADFEQAARVSFEKLRNLKTYLDKAYNLDLQLSMGMSQDFRIAKEYGSNWVRIGSQIFGARA